MQMQHDYFASMTETLQQAADALVKTAAALKPQQVEQLVQLFATLQNQKGSLIFCGVGKSGFVGQKLAATFCSLGLSSTFLHPVEALHGDLGRVTASDAIVLISKSGTTEEILRLLPFLPMAQTAVVGLLGSLNSPIAKSCSLVFDCSVEREACINNLAPTTSTTVAMAFGDAMAVAYENFIGLSRENFAFNHPGGLLGKSLRLLVRDLMIPLSQSPQLSSEATLKDVIMAMTERPLGILAIVDEQIFQGIIVEGDIRRTLAKEKEYRAQGHNILELPATMVMNQRPVRVQASELALHALELMEKRERQISVLPVFDSETFVGVIRLHDLIREGLAI